MEGKGERRDKPNDEIEGETDDKNFIPLTCHTQDARTESCWVKMFEIGHLADRARARVKGTHSNLNKIFHVSII